MLASAGRALKCWIRTVSAQNSLTCASSKLTDSRRLLKWHVTENSFGLSLLCLYLNSLERRWISQFQLPSALLWLLSLAGGLSGTPCHRFRRYHCSSNLACELFCDRARNRTLRPVLPGKTQKSANRNRCHDHHFRALQQCPQRPGRSVHRRCVDCRQPQQMKLR